MILALFLFLVGLVVGSAINSFLWRYQSKTTYRGRSMCPDCRHQLSWYDNIPLISWAFLSGRCRYCKKAISIQYPIVELLTAISFFLIGLFTKDGIYVNHVGSAMIVLGTTFSLNYFYFGISRLVILLLIATALISIAVFDYKTKVIPNGFNFTLIGSSFAFLILNSFSQGFNGMNFLSFLASGFVAFLFFYSLVFFSKEKWMGGGDAKMALAIGLLVGPTGTFLAIMIASISGSIYGVPTLLSSRVNAGDRKNDKKSEKNLSAGRHEVPFGPFLAFGTFVALIFGPQIIGWYVKIVLGM